MIQIIQGSIHRSRAADDHLFELERNTGPDSLLIIENHRPKTVPGGVWTVNTLGSEATYIYESQTQTMSSSTATYVGGRANVK